MQEENFFTDDEIKYHRDTIKRTANLYDKLIDVYWKERNIKVIRGGTNNERVWFDQPNRMSMMATCNNCNYKYKIRNEDIFKVLPCPCCNSPYKNKTNRPQGRTTEYTPETVIANILNINNIAYERETPLNNNKYPLCSDFHIYGTDYSIECQGDEHFSNAGIDAYKTTLNEHNINFIKQIIRDIEKWRLLNKKIYYYIPKNTGIIDPINTVIRNLENSIKEITIGDFNSIIEYANRNGYLYNVPVLFKNNKQKTLDVLSVCLKHMYSKNMVFFKPEDILLKLKKE